MIYIGDKTKINRRGTQVGRMDLVKGSASDLVHRRVPVHLQHNRRVRIHICTNFSRSHSKYHITGLYQKIGQSSVLLEVAGIGHVEKFPPETGLWHFNFILTHYASHTAKHLTGIQKRTRCSNSQLLPSTSLIRPRQNIVSNTFISLL